MKTISYEELEKEKSYILVDVRTPAEYEKEGIPNSINIPVLLDEERIEVGTAYKEISPEAGKTLGMMFISKRLPEIFNEISQISKKTKKIIFYCARGGMRSGSMTALFGSLGYNILKLDGGYKKYREFIGKKIKELNENVEYIIVHGKTGIGKTKILQSLEKKGYSVLDLEKLADHKGSFFGGLCEKRGQSQKRFESLIYNFFKTTLPKYVICESESKRIGDVYIPDTIFESMKQGRHIFADTPLEHRIKIVMEDYSDTGLEAIRECILKLRRYAKIEYVDNLLKLLEEKNLESISKELIEGYYDALYQKSIDKYSFKEKIFYNSIEEGVEELIKILGIN
jgi:tRNA 2-selenouridine synthase